MFDFLKNFQLDRLSFWLGFLAATLLWLVARRLVRYFPLLRDAIKARIKAFKQNNLASIGDRLRRDTLRRVQELHVASSLFSLDEIAQEPALLAPPPNIEPGTDLPAEDTTQLIIPYLPDFPELASAYDAATLSLPQALSEGANIVIIGQPGSGKTFALARLASQIARQAPEAAGLAGMVPLYIHAGDLELTLDESRDPLQAVIDVASERGSLLSQAQLPGFIRAMAGEGQLLLLLDGLDEMPRAGVDAVTAFVGALLKKYPGLRLVAAASPEYAGGLVALKLTPLALATWNAARRARFVEQWGSLWKTQVEPILKREDNFYPVETALVNSWLQGELANLSPLELTLKVWALYAGDSRGAKTTDAFEAYLRRVIPTARMRPGVEQLAYLLVMSGQPSIQRGSISSLAPELNQAADTLDESQLASKKPAAKKRGEKLTAIQRAIGLLAENGLVWESLNDTVFFSHPALLGYLAAQSIKETDSISALAGQPAWAGKHQLMHYLAARSDVSNQVSALLDKDSFDPLEPNLFAIARWLPDAPANAPWRSLVMRSLLDVMQNAGLPLAMRARATAGFAVSGDASVSLLFSQLLGDREPVMRALGALGCGALQDARPVSDLAGLLNDSEHSVRFAACLALANTGTPTAIEAVKAVMVHADEDLARVASEALAKKPLYGHAILRDAAASDNLLIRRASVYGLARIPERWAMEILEKMRIEDGQWVVRNAATQAVEEAGQPNPYVPRPLAPAHDAAWLIAFAGKQGQGIVPGQPVDALLLDALECGSPEEKLAAMTYLRHAPAPSRDLIGALYKLAFSPGGTLRETAAGTLWLMALGGAELPNPAEFRLG